MTRTREALAGTVMVLQALALLVGALAVVAIPHSVCHTTSAGIRRCGGTSGSGAAAALAGAAVIVLVVAVALIAQAHWARGIGLVVSAVLAGGGLVALGVSFLNASADDRSTYGALWIIGLVVVAIFAAPVPLLRRGAVVLRRSARSS
jgi:hypothetical protein